MDTTNSSENQQRRVEDRKSAEVIDWAAPGAPAVPLSPAATSGDAPADLQQLKALALAITSADSFAGTRNAFDAFQAAATPNVVLGLIARIERAAAPAPSAPFAWMKPNEITGLIEASGKDGEARHYGRIYARQYDTDMVPVCAASQATASGDERVHFEAWHRSKFAKKHCTGQPTRDMHNGVYAEQYSPEYQQLMWEAWQARAAVSAATKPNTEQIADVIERLIGACVMDWHSSDPDDAFNSDNEERRTLVEAVDKALAAKRAATKPTADLSKLMSTSIRDYPDFTEDVLRLSEPGLSRKQAKIIRKAIYDTIDARVRNSIIAAQVACERADVQSLLATKPAAAPAVPEGWKLVPPNVTPEMQRAYFAVIDKNMPKVTTSPTFGRWDSMREAYRAMIAATPAASTIGAAQTAEQVPQRTHQPEKCWSRDEENFSYQSLEDLLDTHDELKPGDTVWVADAVRPDMNRLIDADDVTQTMGERAYDIAGEHAEDYPDVSKEAEDELNALLAGWISKNCAPTFWGVENVRAYVLSDDDCQAATQTTEGAGNADQA